MPAEDGPVGPVDSSTIEPVGNGHMVTTRFHPHPKHPESYPAPKVAVFEGGKSNDHLTRAMNHLYKMHGGKGTLAVDTDKDGH
jgi:hypothetical protein